MEIFIQISWKSWLIINSWIYSIRILFIINSKKSTIYHMYNIEQIDGTFRNRSYLSLAINMLYSKGIGVRSIACKCIFTLSRSKILRPRYENTWICKNSTICRDISLFLAAQFIFSSCFRLYSKHRSSFSTLELCFYDSRELTCLKIGRNFVFYLFAYMRFLLKFSPSLTNWILINLNKFKWSIKTMMRQWH